MTRQKWHDLKPSVSIAPRNLEASTVEVRVLNLQDSGWWLDHMDGDLWVVFRDKHAVPPSSGQVLLHQDVLEGPKEEKSQKFCSRPSDGRKLSGDESLGAWGFSKAQELNQAASRARDDMTFRLRGSEN